MPLNRNMSRHTPTAPKMPSSTSNLMHPTIITSHQYPTQSERQHQTYKGPIQHPQHTTSPSQMPHQIIRHQKPNTNADLTKSSNHSTLMRTQYRPQTQTRTKSPYNNKRSQKKSLQSMPPTHSYRMQQPLHSPNNSH